MLGKGSLKISPLQSVIQTWWVSHYRSLHPVATIVHLVGVWLLAHFNTRMLTRSDNFGYNSTNGEILGNPLKRNGVNQWQLHLFIKYFQKYCLRINIFPNVSGYTDAVDINVLRYKHAGVGLFDHTRPVGARRAGRRVTDRIAVLEKLMNCRQGTHK